MTARWLSIKVNWRPEDSWCQQIIANEGQITAAKGHMIADKGHMTPNEDQMTANEG